MFAMQNTGYKQCVDGMTKAIGNYLGFVKLFIS